MAKTDRCSNPVILRSGTAIGNVSAEADDEFLFDCFVEHPAVDVCSNIRSPGMVLAGRTGSGKTAVLRHIERTAEHSVQIDPTEMSLSYVSNSDTLRFVQAIGGDLDLLFLALWKHVLCIEFIRLRYNVRDEEKSKTIFSGLVERFRADARKQKSLKYLREWDRKFWITADQNIKEITEKYENKLQAELGGEINKFRTRGQYGKQLSTEKKSELAARAKRIINEEQLVELSGVIEILADQANDYGMTRFYILLDNLDDRWVDLSIRFRLIRSLIECLKSFRKITNLKVIVAIRSDILERVIQETGDLTFQREKFEDYFVRLSWTKKQLRELIDRRVGLLFRRQYSACSDVKFEHVFPHKIANIDPFDYILERTLMRPRDVITFVNACLEQAAGRHEVTAKAIREAEGNFSRIRRQALEYEWQSAFPSLPQLLDYVKSNRKAIISFRELCEKDAVEGLAYSICTETKSSFDPLCPLGQKVFNEGDGHLADFVKEVISVLYRVGAIGVKLRSSTRYTYSHIDVPVLATDEITNETQIRIHPMLQRSLGIGEHAS